MDQKRNKSYALADCGLHNIQSRKKLAERLLIGPAALKKLTDGKDRYCCWRKQKKCGGERVIEAPFDDLKKVQKRISELLQRVSAPDYLMAPARRRSYVDNASAHVGAKAFRLLDIENFFPSCTEKRVYWFFRTVLQCSVDVAATLSNLATRNGHLPQGSPCSPVLAFYSYLDMWESIRKVVSVAGCRLTIYADDITISGSKIKESDVWEIKKLLHKFGHRFSREKERSVFGRPADITGVIVTIDALLLPNRQHKALSIARHQLSAAPTQRERALAKQKIGGRVAQANQIAHHLERKKVLPPMDQTAV
jgi:hypothetical protein